MLKVCLFLFCCFFIVLISHAQDDSTQYFHSMDSLWNLHESKKLDDTMYLNAANVLATAGYGIPAYSESLVHFRKLAFDIQKPSIYKVMYYNHLAIDADINEQAGRCIFFEEKQIAELKKARPENAAADVILPLYLISMYQDVKRYDLSMNEYQKVLSELNRIPYLIQCDSITASSVLSSLKIISFALPAIKEYNDTNGIRHAYKLAQEIYKTMQTVKKSDYVKLLSDCRHEMYIVQFYYHKYLFPKEVSTISKDIQLMRHDLLAPKYQKNDAYARPYLLGLVYLHAYDYYFDDNKNLDSAIHYLHLYEVLDLDSSIKYDKNYYNMLSNIAASRKDYKSAWQYMETAFKMAEIRKNKSVVDKNNNLYAQAQAEEKQQLLTEAELKNEESAKRLQTTFIIIIFLLIFGAVLILYIRQRYKNRFLGFKLHLARNVHDETGPALLYAKTLAKHSRTGEDKSELEQHIEHTMEVIRSLAHDLKSDKHYTLNDLIKYMEETLEKINADKSFTYTVNKTADGKRFISHYQFSQIKAILNECITNSIKHAGFDKINIAFKCTGNKLIIDYTDNGKGWSAESTRQGIGMRNIQERLEQLNGELSIRNNYPEGYNINLTVMLR